MQALGPATPLSINLHGSLRVFALGHVGYSFSCHTLVPGSAFNALYSDANLGLVVQEGYGGGLG